MENFFTSSLFLYVGLPLLIFLSRIIDVTIGTVRIILVAKGQKRYAAGLGFVESLLWLVAMGAIMANLTNIVAYFAYAAGFSAGNYVGIILEEKLAMGNVIVQVITKKKAGDLLRILRARRLRITHMEARGNDGEVAIILILIKRKHLDTLIKRIKKSHPKAFFSIEDVRFVSEGLMPLKHGAARRNRLNFLKVSRHEK